MEKWKRIEFGPSTIEKADPAILTTLQKLRSFLDKNEPRLVYFLVNFWRNQELAITYKELREAIVSGELDPALLQEWQLDYGQFVIETMYPAWQDAIIAGAAQIEEKYPEFYFNPMKSSVRKWTERHAAKFVTNSTQTQIQAVRALVHRAANLEGRSVDNLARAIRATVGLTYQQGIANFNYYNRLIENGMKEEKALDLSIRYAGRQHRYRGYNIARTELAFAYNQGSYEGTKQAQAAGYMGTTVKVWCTADDERVCKICGKGGLEGMTIGIDDDFPFHTRIATPDNPTILKVPPAHPSCRCAVMYKEISPPTR